MRLFLSSQDFGNHADALVELVDKKSVVYIGNAKDAYDLAERNQKSIENKIAFECIGFDFYEIDLRNYFENNSDLEDEIKSCGLVWLGGGNTFLLRRALVDSGADEIIKRLVNEDLVVYGGSSAGSIIPTPSLKGTENGDDPEAVREIYGKDATWEGLSLVDFHVVPHYESEWFGVEAQAMKDYFVKNNLKHHALNDGQVYIVDGERQELLQ